VLTPQGLGNAAAAVQADNKAAKGASGTSSASKLEVPSARAAASAPPWQIRTRSMSSKAAVSPRAAAAAAAAVKQQGGCMLSVRQGSVGSMFTSASSWMEEVNCVQKAKLSMACQRLFVRMHAQQHTNG
jgi:hypothetical protein